jgi:DNA-binding response OmpR family regulator
MTHRILIVTSNQHLALGLRTMLAERGHAVRCENDSRDAVDAMREFEPDTLLTACEETVFVGRRNASEIAELKCPVDTVDLLRVLET